MNKYLFVGGPKDGQRIAVPAAGMPTRVMASSVQDCRSIDDKFPMGVHTYFPHFFRNEQGQDHVAYFHSSIQNDFLGHLIEGYRSPQ